MPRNVAKPRLCAFTVLLLLLLPPPAEALQIREAREDRHHRILSTGAVNTGFLFHDYDPSGIAIDQDTLPGAGRATMITRQHFVTSTHTAGTHPNFLTFLARDGTRREYRVAGYRRIEASTDLTVGRLVEPIPEDHGIAHYAIARVVPPSYDAAMIGLFGMRRMAGINRLDSGTQPGSELFRHDFDGVDNPLFGRGPDEAAPTQGDSGHPMVAAYGGQLFILGIHYTTTSSQSVPRHLEAIREIVEADGERLTVFDRLPRVIADFDPARHARLWADAGTEGGQVSLVDPDDKVGRIGSAVSAHHLIARTTAERPQLVANDHTFPFLRFAPDHLFFAINRHTGTARAFAFELNTEQPRILLLLRVHGRESGLTPIMRMEYATAEEPFRLEYDHGSKRIRSTGFGGSVAAPMREDTWVMVEWIRQREFLALVVDKDPIERGVIHSAHNADTAFTRLRLGGETAEGAAATFDLARLRIADTGLAGDPDLVRTLRAHYGLPSRISRDDVWWPDPGGGEVLRYLIELAAAPQGPWTPRTVRAGEVTATENGWRLWLPRASGPLRFVRVNGGAPLALSTGETFLHLSPESAPSPSSPWTRLTSAEAAFEAHADGAFRLRIEPSPATHHFHRLLIKETDEGMP
ncbi:MAG: hypothetical protein JJT96_06255 [Opitutales bacterium]|nr:hypothetical protein [Opitutales bacterium]